MAALILATASFTCLQSRSITVNALFLLPMLVAAILSLVFAMSGDSGHNLYAGTGVLLVLFLTISACRFQRLSVVRQRLDALHTRTKEWPNGPIEVLRVTDLLRDGSIRLVDLSWLKHAKRLSRRQELADEAFVSPSDAARLFLSSKVAVLSYRVRRQGLPPTGLFVRALIDPRVRPARAAAVAYPATSRSRSLPPSGPPDLCGLQPRPSLPCLVRGLLLTSSSLGSCEAYAQGRVQAGRPHP